MDAIVVNLEDRFPDASILNAFSLFDPQQLPPSDSDEFEIYGNTAVETLTTHYITSISNCQDLEIEWIGFKQLLAEKFTASSATEVMQSVLKSKTLSVLYPNLAKLACIGLTLLVSTATCERSFSAMKRIKTDLRNRLITSTLDCLIRISIDESSADKFDFESAASQWGALKKCRILV